MVRSSPKIHLLPACILAGLFLLTSSRAASAAPLPVSVNPTRIEIEAPPGGHITQTIKFWNGTNAELPIHVEPSDVSQSDEEGHAAVEPEGAANSLKAWITPAVPDVNVYPKQEIALDFAIDVPGNADPGTHWGAVLVTTAPQGGAGAGAAIQARIGTIILVRVLGDAKENLALESFSGPKYLQEPPITLEARFKNEGTVHEVPQGAIEVRNWLGDIVATGTIPERNVLPNTVRKISTQVSGRIWFGKYTATLTSSYGDANEALPESTVQFWVVPWRRYGPGFVVVAFVISFIVWRRNRLPAVWHVLRTGKVPEQI